MSKFPWLESYPDFVSHSTEINYENIVEIYDQSIRNFGDKVAYKNMDVELTYNELDNHVNALIHYFQNNTSLKKGDKIVLQMPNLLQYPVAIFACLKAGLVIVNTNPLYTADEMLHQYKDSGAKAVIIVENFAQFYLMFTKYITLKIFTLKFSKIKLVLFFWYATQNPENIFKIFKKIL